MFESRIKLILGFRRLKKKYSQTGVLGQVFKFLYF